jgi:hypothetical protein
MRKKKLGGSISTLKRRQFVVDLEVEETGEIAPNLLIRNTGHL